MEKKDKVVVVLAIITFAVSICWELDFNSIADAGLTLCSIVLAVYIAAVIGLINTNLAKKMAKSIAPQDDTNTQLGVLVKYFKYAIFISIATIILSSLNLLFYYEDLVKILLYRVFSAISLVVYFENLLFFIFIVKFILNRQIWDK